MFLRRKVFEELLKQYYETRGANQALERNYASLMTTMDWMRVRVTQLEMERAQLIKTYTGVVVPTPVIRNTNAIEANPMSQLPNFEDVGDEEAAKLGLDWNPDGTLRYTTKD